MASTKTFNSKNFSKQIESLLSLGKVDLVIDILKTKELQSLLPNILENLKRKAEKKANYNQTKIYSKTDLDKESLKLIENVLKVDTNNVKIIIDESVSAGFILKSADKYVDASMETMLQTEIEKLIAKNY